MIQDTIQLLKSMGFKWDTKTIGVMHTDKGWDVNVMLINEDGSKKPVYGFLKFDTVDEAVEAEVAMSAQ